MGVFSRHIRYRDAGQGTNVNNIAEFGKPVRSLFTSTKVLSLHQATEITDDEGAVAYRTCSKFFSIRDKTDVTDADGNQVAHIERKFWTLHERHFVNMADGTDFQLSNELWHIVKDVTNIEGLGWVLRGNIAGLNFQLYDPAGAIIAVVSQKLISLHDKYCIDIYQPEHEKTAVAILVALQHMMRDRAASSSSVSFSSSSSS